ncbi:hypothetical protein ANCDUO_23846 [Ancylostoma duodenale]|uniref:Uncharacterized protein n=1 Tax=Ancylostoma duodenale TaxID=51022 RepID=A0A0C2FH77_9BILA|nr:hypothetical protein ANCDUO_23846 [Ancylostoma duodenale]
MIHTLQANYELSGDASEFAEFYHTRIKPGTLNSFAAGIGEVSSSISSPTHHDDGRYLLSGAVVRPQLKEFGGNIFNHLPQHGAESAALLIHRSRDHGIPGYVKFREYCTGEKITSFGDLKDIVVEPHHLIPTLRDLYKSVEDVDLLALALAEKPVRGSLVGRTLGCILAFQYRKVFNIQII